MRHKVLKNKTTGLSKKSNQAHQLHANISLAKPYLNSLAIFLSFYCLYREHEFSKGKD